MKHIFFLALLCPFLSNCQPLTLHGKIINEQREPISGATITVKRSSKPLNSSTPQQLNFLTSQLSTIANDEGEFTISNLQLNDTLLITAIGYEPTTEIFDFTVQNHDVTVVLKRKTTSLDDVVIIAYGTTSKRLNLSTISEITSKDIASQPVSNPLSALQGRVPGLIINQSTGIPGSAFNIELRGRTSLDPSLSRNDPLFIIDGIPFESGNGPSNLINSSATSPVSTSTSSPGGLSPLASISPSDIESITVLKDAGATAIYGSRGANGVILITTKRAKGGKLRATVDAYSGFSKAIFNTAFLNTAQYIAMRREAFAGDGTAPTTSTAPDLLLWDTTRYTNFQKLLTGGTARTWNAQASVSGGSPTTRFTLGGGYRKESSVFPGTSADARTSVHLNLFHSPASAKWSLNLSALWSSANNRLLHTDLTKYISLPPNLKLYNADGSLAWSDAGITYASLGFSNPMVELAQQYTAITNNLTSGLLLNYKIFPFLSLRLNAGYNSFTTDEKTVTPKSAIDPANSTTASSAFAWSNRAGWLLEPQAEFSKKHGKREWQWLLGTTLQENKYSNASINATGYTNDLLLYSLAAAGSVTASNYNSLYRYTAIFSRVTYAGHEKYLLNLSARRDGSTRFGPGRRFANFGALSAGWIFSAEPFMKELSFLSFGKLRGSYGITGNDQIGDYKYLDLWTSTSNPYAGVPGLRPSFLFNPAFEWEKNKKWEAAIDLGFLEDRLSLSLAWYRSRSSNQLVNFLLPNQTGFASVVKNLPAIVQNTGLECTADAKIISTKAVQWRAAFNITIPSNKLVSFPGLASSSYNFTYVEGKSLTVQRKLKFLGVDPATGLYAYEDYNKDGSISTPADLQVLNNLDPDFYGGFSNSLTWKSLSLDFLFQFSKTLGTNYLAYSYTAPAGFLYNQPTLVLDRWQHPGDIAAVQRYGATASSPVFLAANRLSASDAVYSDASYIRLKNAVLAFNFSTGWLKKRGLEGAKLCLETQDLLTITNYKGSDPETQNFYRLPPLRTLALGLTLNF